MEAIPEPEAVNPVPEPGLPIDQDCQRMFATLWDELSSVIGTPATASLLKRAMIARSEAHPELGQIVIVRQALTYVYRIPKEVTAADGACVPAFKALLEEVLGLVGELTGGVMLRKLLRCDGLSHWLPDGQEVRSWQTLRK